MPRPKKEAAAEPKKRSRTGCWPCKARKVKCGEEKPICANCQKSGETCDYSIRLNWGGRSRKERDGTPSEAGSFTFVTTPTSATSTHAKTNSNGHDHVFSAQHLVPAPQRPPSSHPVDLPTPEPTPGSDGTTLDPRLRLAKQNSHPDYPSGHYGGMSYNPQFNWQRSPGSAERSPPTSAPTLDDSRWSPEHSAKRVKLNSPPNSHPSPAFALPPYPAPQFEQSPPSNHYTPHSISSIVNTPATPGSTISSGSPFPTYQQPLTVQDPPDLRRLSVKSLLSEPSEEPERTRFLRSQADHGWRTYGYDHGLDDLDVPNNDDNNVIQPKSPDLRRASTAVSEVSSSSNEPDGKQIAFEPGGYYAKPVPIKLPRSLEPLPPELLENQMNLLYFHHFINHTGRILVPHDCPENPFRGVLPQMAVRNQHLLHLLLAFSASHRARLLNQPEPASRIAAWMSDVLPALRQALAEPSSPGVLGMSDPTDPSSLAPLATAIMLASLEIVSPNTFAVSISWQQHLHTARELIIAKGGLDHLAQKADGARDKAIFFISRWFAYLDVFGSLSGGQQEQPLYGAYLEDGGGLWLVNRDPNVEIYQIDCFFGFSGRCISLLAQVAELAFHCDKQRIDQINKTVVEGWQPPEDIRQQAEELQKRILESATTAYQGCTHANPNSDAHESQTPQELEEICATNELYHWGGLIHLQRRVLGRPSTDAEVQDSVQRVIRSLGKVRRGSSAESCLLFPLFTAGCEALSAEERDVFAERMRGVEPWGMDQFGRARVLMETVWSTGRPWETLVSGEFFG